MPQHSSNFRLGFFAAALGWVAGVCLALTAPLAAADLSEAAAKRQLTERARPIAVPAGSKFDVHLTLRPPAIKGTAHWRHVVDKRTLSAGEVSIAAAAPAVLRLQIPALKEGESVKTTLEVSLRAETGDLPAQNSTISQLLWIVEPNPWAGKKKWVEQLALSLYDPLGKTAKALQQTDFKFTQVATVGALERTEKGIVLVGEGIELDKTAGVGKAILILAQRGVPVICLPPRSGDLPFPSASAVPAKAMRFASDDRVPCLDKRISVAAWTAEPSADAATLTEPTLESEPPAAVVLRGEVVDEAAAKDAAEENGAPPLPLTVRRYAPVVIRNEMRLAVSEAGDGFPWVVADYTDKPSVVLCGFPLVATWRRDATARYFLAAMLQMLRPEREMLDNVTPSKEKIVPDCLIDNVGQPDSH